VVCPITVQITTALLHIADIFVTAKTALYHCTIASYHCTFCVSLHSILCLRGGYFFQKHHVGLLCGKINIGLTYYDGDEPGTQPEAFQYLTKGN